MIGVGVGVVGVGNIGATICADALLHGFAVVGVDRDRARLEAAHDEIVRVLRFAPLLRPSLPRVELDEALARLELTTELPAIARAKLVIENVPERWPIKQALYAELDPILADAFAAGAVLGANTSSLAITRIAALTSRPDRVVGAHFMNPCYLSELVEVIRGTHSDPQAIAAIVAFATALGKDHVIVEDHPGFVSNRVSHLMMNEAAFLVFDGVASPAAVDRVFQRGFGHRMGPLATADLIGLDTVVDTLDALAEATEDPKFRCCPLLRELVAAGKLGRKSGQGFFEYPDE